VIKSRLVAAASALTNSGRQDRHVRVRRRYRLHVECDELRGLRAR
jgi:hypothetical protein